MSKFKSMEQSERPSGSERTVLSIVLRNTSIARSGITALTHLSQQSVHRIVDTLEERGLLKLEDPQISGRGKPSPRVKIETERFVSIGISIGTEEARICAMDLAGQPIIQDVLDADPGEPDMVLSAFEAKTSQWLHSRLSQTHILGMGVAMQGHRIERRDVFVTPAPLAKWEKIALTDRFGDHFGLPVFAENNATCSATAEFYLGAVAEVNCLAYLSFNYGFGAGIFSDRDAFLGGHGNAGEISSIFTLDQAEKRPALGELVKRLDNVTNNTSSVGDLAKNVDLSNAVVENWLKEVGPQLCLAIRALKAVADPNLIIFGGEAPENLRAALVSLAADAFEGQLSPNPVLRTSDIPYDPAHIGAALLPLHKLIY